MSIQLKSLDKNDLLPLWQLGFCQEKPRWKDFDAPYFNDYQAFSTVDEFLYSDRAASFLSDIADGKFVLLASDASYAKKSW